MSKTIHCQCIICKHNNNFTCQLEHISLSGFIPKCESFVLSEKKFQEATNKPWVDVCK